MIKKKFSTLQEANDFIRNRQGAYLAVFGGEPAKAVLEDLKEFCRADETTFHVDARAHALAEGRREVWLRIKKHLDLAADQVVEYFNGGN